MCDKQSAVGRFEHTTKDGYSFIGFDKGHLAFQVYGYRAEFDADADVARKLYEAMKAYYDGLDNKHPCVGSDCPKCGEPLEWAEDMRDDFCWCRKCDYESCGLDKDKPDANAVLTRRPL